MSANFTPEQIEQFLEEFFNVVGRRQYVGARYVPIFGRKGETSINWDNTAPYEPLTIVLYQGDSYTSRTYVPAGVDILNQNYWALTGNYNAQIEAYRNEVLNVVSVIPTSDFSDTNTVKKYIDDSIGDVEAVIPTTDFDSTNTVKKYIDDSVEFSSVIPATDFDSTNTVKKYIDDSVGAVNNAVGDIAAIMPATNFDSTNTVKKYIDDSVDAVETIIPATDFDSTNTVKKYIEDLDFDNAYNRTVHATYANFTKVGQIPLGENEHCQGMTFDDAGNIYVVIGNNTTHVYKLRKHNSSYEAVREVNLPTNAHGNCLDYNTTYGIFVFDSTGVILQYDTSLNLINTITTTGTVGYGNGFYPGSGAVSKDADMLHVMVTHACSNRAMLFMNNKDTLARYGEIDIYSTNSCYQQGCFGGSSTFYQLYAAQDDFKHSFVSIYMYRGRKIRDVFLLGVGYEPQDITRYGNNIYVVNVDGELFMNDEYDKWSYRSSDTTNDVYSNNYMYNPCVLVTENGTIQYTSADAYSITATFPYKMIFPANVDGRIIDIVYPIRFLGGKIGFLVASRSAVRIVYIWCGIQIILYYQSTQTSPYDCELKVQAMETYINGTRSYFEISNAADMQTKFASILSATYSYQIGNGGISIPNGQNTLNESVTGSTLVKLT